MNILSTRIKNKHDDLSNWINFNPILLEGEIGLVKFPDGTENMKIGNGVSSFSDLPYVIEPFSFEILSGNFPEPIEDNLGKVYLLNKNLVEIENAKRKIMSFDTSEASSYWIEPIFPESETDTYKQKCPYSEGTRRYSTEIDSETGTISAYVDSVEAFFDLEYDVNQNDSGLTSLVSSSRSTLKIILNVDELDFNGKIFVPIDFGYHAYFKNAAIVGRENRTVLKNITIRTDHSTNYRTSYIWVTPVGIVKYATTLSAYNLEIKNEVIANDRMISSSGAQTVGFLAGLVSGGNSAGHPYVFDNILFDNCTILGRNYNGLVIGSTYDTDNQVLFSNLSVENSNLICYGIGPDSASQYNRYLGYCRASQDSVSASFEYRNVVYTINKKNGDFSDVGCLGFFTQYILNRNGVTGELEYSQIIDDLYLSSYTKTEIDEIVSSINDSISSINDSIAIVRNISNDSAIQIQLSATPVVSGDSNFSISKNSLAVGASNVAGLKGYKYTNTGSVTNSLTFEVVPEGWEIGDVVSIVNKDKYSDCATISSISETTVTFTENLPFDSIVDESDWDSKTAYVSTKPSIGNVELGYGAYAEGLGTKALNVATHAEGRETQALGQYSHAEGRDTIAQYCAHAEGQSTKALGIRAHSEGYDSSAVGNSSHAEGQHTTAIGQASHIEGHSAVKVADNIIKGGNISILSSWNSSTSKFSLAKGVAAHVEGKDNLALDDQAHSEGLKTIAQGQYSHSEGTLTKAVAHGSHAEGTNSVAGGTERPSKNTDTTAGRFAHAEGNGTFAQGNSSHAEGKGTQALKPYSHAEGLDTIANGNKSHAEGLSSVANGEDSHAEGGSTVTSNRYEHAQGRYNKSNKANTTFGNSGNTIHSIGIGTSNEARKNAVEVMQDGKVFITGVGEYNGTNPNGSNVKDLKTVLDENGNILESVILSIDGLSNEISSLENDLNLSVGNIISSISGISSTLSISISALELSVVGLSNSLSSLSTSFVELSGNVYLKDETYDRTEIDEKVEFLSGEISSLESSLVSVSNSLSNYVPISGNVNVENALSISENLFVGGKSLLSIILENSSKVLLREWS